MKKTLLASLAFAALAIPSSAETLVNQPIFVSEEVPVGRDYDYVDWQPTFSDIVLSEGKIVIKNFLNTGSPITITYDLESYEYYGDTYWDITSFTPSVKQTSGNYNFYYFLDKDNQYMDVTVLNDEEEEVALEGVWSYYGYVSQDQTTGEKWLGMYTVSGDDKTYLWLDIPLFPASSKQDVKVYTYDYNTYNKLSDTYTTTLVRNEDGSYTLGDVLDANAPLSFTFGDFYDDGYGYTVADTEFVGDNLDTEDYYPYLLDNDDDYAVLTFKLNGEEEYLYWPVIYPGSYSPIYKAEDGYQAMFLFCADYEDESYTYFYLSFDFNELAIPESEEPDPDDPSAVKGIESSNSPVEYYNLQGIKVANPENGIFIRRQGNKVSKAVVR